MGSVPSGMGHQENIPTADYRLNDEEYVQEFLDFLEVVALLVPLAFFF